MTTVVAALADDVRAALDQLSKATEAVLIGDTLLEKRAAEIAARPVMREVRSKISMLRAEVRRTQDATLRTQYEKICYDADEKVRALDAAMRQQINPGRTARPTTDAGPTGAGGPDEAGFQDSKEVLQAAIDTQQDALVSLGRAERLQQATEEMGQETLLTVQRQTEQMYHVDEELQNLQGELDRAGREVRWFFRLLAGDRCFLSLFGICVVALAVLVFVLIFQSRRKRYRTE